MKYFVQLSNKTEVPIDEDELQNVLTGIQSGSPVKVRQGIFNPSFFVAIVEDYSRRPLSVYNGDKPPLIQERGNLPDIFSETKKLTNE